LALPEPSSSRSSSSSAPPAVVFKGHLSDARGYLQPLYRLGEFIKHGGVAQWVTGCWILDGGWSEVGGWWILGFWMPDTGYWMLQLTFPPLFPFSFGLISKQLRLYWQLCCKFIGMLCKLG